MYLKLYRLRSFVLLCLSEQCFHAEENQRSASDNVDYLDYRVVEKGGVKVAALSEQHRYRHYVVACVQDV